MRARFRQAGLALVTALLVVAIAATLAASLAFGQQVWLRQMQNMADRTNADFLERGAIAWAATVFADASSSVNHLGEPWARPIPVLPVPGGAIRGSVEDAQGRFNLNNVWANNAKSQADVDVFERLLAGAGASGALATALAAALVDWIDPDSQASLGGAEDIDYLQFDPPYRAANQPLASVDELRLVRGFTPELVEALRPYVTAIPGRTAINVNTAQAPVVAALVPGLSLAEAEQLLADRERTPFQSTGEFLKKLRPGIQAPGGDTFAVNTGHFLVMLDIVMGRHQRRTEVLVARAGGKVVWHRPQPLVLAAAGSE
jgi:general secretion pathway protein K